MRLTKFTDLALRVVVRLVRTDGAHRITAKEVAAAVGAPPSHVAKAASRLQHLGVVEARRGRNGGLVLTEFGLNTSVGRIARALEGTGDVVGCLEEPPCPLLRGCALRAALSDAQEAFFAHLDRVPVQALITDRGAWPLTPT